MRVSRIKMDECVLKYLEKLETKGKSTKNPEKILKSLCLFMHKQNKDVISMTKLDKEDFLNHKKKRNVKNSTLNNYRATVDDFYRYKLEMFIHKNFETDIDSFTKLRVAPPGTKLWDIKKSHK